MNEGSVKIRAQEAIILILPWLSILLFYRRLKTVLTTATINKKTYLLQ